MAYRKYDQQLKDTVIEEVLIGERIQHLYPPTLI